MTRAGATDAQSPIQHTVCNVHQWAVPCQRRRHRQSRLTCEDHNTRQHTAPALGVDYRPTSHTMLREMYYFVPAKSDGSSTTGTHSTRPESSRFINSVPEHGIPATTATPPPLHPLLTRIQHRRHRRHRRRTAGWSRTTPERDRDQTTKQVQRDFAGRRARVIAIYTRSSHLKAHAKAAAAVDIRVVQHLRPPLQERVDHLCEKHQRVVKNRVFRGDTRRYTPRHGVQHTENSRWFVMELPIMTPEYEMPSTRLCNSWTHW